MAGVRGQEILVVEVRKHPEGLCYVYCAGENWPPDEDLQIPTQAIQFVVGVTLTMTT
jgi:hypothetical protein